MVAVTSVVEPKVTFVTRCSLFVVRKGTGVGVNLITDAVLIQPVVDQLTPTPELKSFCHR